MTTAAPVSITWTPEDDLLLKNAIEAGASLQALGKGAVPFSRRFTFEELQDRWHSLLYDPVVSAHASAYMFELELSGFSPSSKSIKSENYKGYKNVPEKRQRSIRKQYYATRKRLRSEFFNSTDFRFIDDNIVHDCDDHESNMREPHDGKFVSDSLGLQKADLDILRNVFPETVRDYDSSAVVDPNNACSAEFRNPIGDEYPNRIFRNKCPDASSLLRENERDPSVPDIKCYEIHGAAKSNGPNSGKLRADNKSLPVQVPAGKRHFKSFGKKQLPACDSGIDSPHGACGFGGSQLLNSPDAETNSPLQVIGCSSPQPLWKTMEDFSVPSMPVCVGNQGTTEDVATLLPNDVARKGVRSSVFDIVQSGPFLGGEHSSNDLPEPVASDGDFVDISDSLLNLSNEDEMPCTDIDEKESVKKIVNDSVNLGLKNSAGVVQEVDKVKLEHTILNSEESGILVQNMPKPIKLEDKVECEPVLEMVEKRAHNDLHPVKTEVVLSSPLIDYNVVSHSEGNVPIPVKTEVVLSSPLIDYNVVSHLEGNVPIAPVDHSSIPSSSAVSAESGGQENDIICCALNTEDPDIPCNDDIFLLIHPSPVFSSSASPPFSGDTLSPSSICKGKITEQQMNLSSKGNNNSQSFKRHQSVRSSFSLDAHVTNPSCVSKPKLYDVARVGVSPATASRPTIDSSVNNLWNITSNPSTDRLLEKEIARAQLKDKDGVASFLDMPQYAESGLLQGQVAEPAISTILSDSEGSQGDDDVPYPSDVEAVILEMDLDPPEESSINKQALCLEDNKTIMRLEQCAWSSFQRKLTQKGAFAILYGHHLAKYIKKTEVVLGRSTDDLKVDIDLRKEGCANKISRRQAIIKLEVDGSFSLKNIGKGVILVNGKSVYTGQSLILSSSCLIEISRMSFAFEINQKYVRRHMEATERRKTQQNKFDWSSDDIS